MHVYSNLLLSNVLFLRTTITVKKCVCVCYLLIAISTDTDQFILPSSHHCNVLCLAFLRFWGFSFVQSQLFPTIKWNRLVLDECYGDGLGFFAGESSTCGKLAFVVGLQCVLCCGAVGDCERELHGCILCYHKYTLPSNGRSTLKEGFLR